MTLIATVLAATAPLSSARAATPSPFSCRYIFSAWQTGFTADLFVTNNGPTVDGWTARWTFEAPTQLLTVWSADMNQSTQHEAVATPMPWNKVIYSGSMVAFGWTAMAPKTGVPTDISINGMPC